MAVQDLNRIEDRIDKVAIGATAVNMEFGGIRFQTYTEVMEFAKTMAVSDCAVPPHLRGNVGTCLAVCTKALRFGFDPYALAEHSFVMKKDMDVTVETPQGGRVTRKEPVTTLAYDSYVIRAVIEAHAPIKGRLRYAYSGDGMERRCLVSAELRATGDVISHESPTLGERIKAIGRSDKGYIKGSPLWESKPDQQLGYDTARDFCRRHFPEVLMGWYDKDELEETVRAETATDITPRGEKPDIATRLLKGSKKKDKDAPGFQAGQVEKTIRETGSGDQAAPQVAATGSGGSGVDIGTGVPGSIPHTAPDPDETALQRGTRLLETCNPADIKDLMATIADELANETERQFWLSACEARMKEARE
jgi:hypothetical protein